MKNVSINRQVLHTLIAVTALINAQAFGQDTELASWLSTERPIAAGQSYWLEELTSMEIRDAIASGTSTVIIATGGIEENGPICQPGNTI